MDPLIVVIIVAIVAGIGLVALLVAQMGGTRASADQIETLAERLHERIDQLERRHDEGRDRLTERFQTQERVLTKSLEDRLADLGRRVGDTLTQNTEKQHKTMSELQERLTRIDVAQTNITQLSEQVVGLQDILANKQARGAFGEIQLKDLVTAALPPSAYAFQSTLGNGRRVDCLLILPNPPGPICIDAKFPLESYHALRAAKDEASERQALRALATAVRTHVRHIAERYIVAGETAESALMFLPSEAIYAELHASLPDVVEDSYRARVWIVSPTTMMATLNTVRAVLKDVQMREQASVIQREVQTMMGDVERLDKRVQNLRTHFQQAEKDIGDIEISSRKITSRSEKIEDLQLGEPDRGPAQDLAPPAQRLGTDEDDGRE
ncbi:MAG: DNA recombination protein RmuC [Acetobacterales bacterium]